jgi:hypothetical protein
MRGAGEKSQPRKGTAKRQSKEEQEKAGKRVQEMKGSSGVSEISAISVKAEGRHRPDFLTVPAAFALSNK